MKPTLSVRSNEGGKSLIRRAKSKLLPMDHSMFTIYEQALDIENKAQVLDLLERFFTLEFK